MKPKTGREAEFADGAGSEKVKTCEDERNTPGEVSSEVGSHVVVCEVSVPSPRKS